jgi:phosphate transport system permease protein
MPLVFLLGAAGWQLLPTHWAVRLETRRFFFILATIPLGLLLGALLGGPLERWFFGGDLKAWLAWEGTPGEPSPFADATGGWLLLCLPLSGLVVSFLSTRLLNPHMRQMSAVWDRRKFALVDGAKLGVSLALTLALAWMLSALLSALGFDPRGSYVDTFVQRNALIVGFVMGFAIIPIIYTISEDALSGVPEHLRAASLGAGATQWQTAIRIILPTAMSGIFSALMVGFGRAVGETMIVLMAAGNTPVRDWNIFSGFRTLSANIAVEMPEAVKDSTHYRTLFLAALVLFALTFVVNTVAELVRLRVRKRAYEL